ncbi:MULTISPECIES: hypothetical protein [Pseudofrankia]|uniref:hypothetical protein n=1 Tax=Pseudofrankia TaxID=2994363 RepID=UPI000688017C|nr:MULTISPECIES: hypothetical protein [Pseudofrankia]OHV33551.1 hypothetical protein BCD49_26265 [Pseudofrankia sp. EUN1h]
MTCARVPGALARRLPAVLAGLAATAVLVAACGTGTSTEPKPASGDQATGPATPLGVAAAAEPTVVMGAGDALSATVEKFRGILGPDNGGAPGGAPNGHREINWDGVPDELAAPNTLPADFFNAAVEPRARGLVLEVGAGGHLSVSADEGNPAGVPVRFGDLNPSYPATFETFSAPRLFTPVGTETVDLKFFVPGTNQPATVRGFGAVYADVDTDAGPTFEYYDADGKKIGTERVPSGPDALSFLGVAYPEPVIASVRIVYVVLGPTEDASHDVAVMDDFFYGEPLPR